MVSRLVRDQEYCRFDSDQPDYDELIEFGLSSSIPDGPALWAHA